MKFKELASLRALFSQKYRRQSAPSAFTLIELLVVVAIISILASIAVPNFLHAQTRAKVARMQADMRTVAIALEAYAVDNNHYPPRSHTGRGVSKKAFPDMLTRHQELARVSTPISYISQIPEDIFENHVAPPNNVIDYWTGEVFEQLNLVISAVEVQEWALLSVGPDGAMGQSPFDGGNLPVIIELTGTFQDEYDPTNGTISLGSVTRTQSGKNFSEIFD